MTTCCLRYSADIDSGSCVRLFAFKPPFKTRVTKQRKKTLNVDFYATWSSRCLHDWSDVKTLLNWCHWRKSHKVTYVISHHSSSRDLKCKQWTTWLLFHWFHSTTNVKSTCRWYEKPWKKYWPLLSFLSFLINLLLHLGSFPILQSKIWLFLFCVMFIGLFLSSLCFKRYKTHRYRHISLVIFFSTIYTL